jgi:hypothetical protein
MISASSAKSSIKGQSPTVRQHQVSFPQSRAPHRLPEFTV